jgi:hypothetical protein
MSVFGMEEFGMTEYIEWSNRFQAWYVRFTKGDWVYERLTEDRPHDMPEAIKKFYRDDAVWASQQEAK